MKEQILIIYEVKLLAIMFVHAREMLFFLKCLKMELYFRYFQLSFKKNLTAIFIKSCKNWLFIKISLYILKYTKEK